jgi:hypothetical protein
MKNLFVHTFIYLTFNVSAQLFTVDNTSLNTEYTVISTDQRENIRVMVAVSSHPSGSLISVNRTDVSTSYTSENSFVIENFPFVLVSEIIINEDGSSFIGFTQGDMLTCFIVAKLSASNNLLWLKSFSDINYYNPYFKNSIIGDENGGLFIKVSDGGFTGIIKIDTHGEIIWTKKYIGHQSFGKSPGFSICNNSVNGIMGTLKEESYQCIFNTDNQGNKIWSRTYFDNLYRWPSTIKKMNDDHYLIAGEVGDNKGNFSVYFHKISSSGQTIFAKRVTFDDYSYYTVSDTKTLDNGTFYILLNKNDGGNTNNTIVFKFDANGNYITNLSTSYVISDRMNHCGFFSKYLSHALNITSETTRKTHVINFEEDINEICFSESISDFHISNDSDLQNATIGTQIFVENYPITITNLNYYNAQNWLQYSISDACNILSINAEYEMESPEIFPNPSNGLIKLDLRSTNYESVFLMDMTGRNIKDICNQCNGEINLNVLNVQSGNYFIVLSTNQDIKTIKVILN